MCHYAQPPFCFSRGKKFYRENKCQAEWEQNRTWATAIKQGHEMSLFLWTSLLHWALADELKLEWSHRCWITKLILTGQFPKTAGGSSHPESLLQRSPSASILQMITEAITAFCCLCFLHPFPAGKLTSSAHPRTVLLHGMKCLIPKSH